MERKCRIAARKTRFFPELKAKYRAGSKFDPRAMFKLGNAFILERNDFWHHEGLDQR